MSVAVRTWIAEHLPESARRLARRAWLGHPFVPQLRSIGTVLDIYYWVSDGELDTLVPIENIFSPFFPDEDTSTVAWVEVYDPAGNKLGRLDGIEVPHLGSPGIRMSEVLRKIRAERVTHGNLLWLLEVPDTVLKRVWKRAPFMFWDRSYIGYLSEQDTVAFVHGVDKFEVVDYRGARHLWPLKSMDSFTASPEMPVDLSDYPVVEIIQQNRSRQARHFELTATDAAGRKVMFPADVAGGGVQRFVLSRDNLRELDINRPLRIEVSGLPTRYGRPLAFKRFANGAIAVMHC